eukprot:506004-Pleurochrysis_carterae.AAC.4
MTFKEGRTLARGAEALDDNLATQYLLAEKELDETTSLQGDLGVVRQSRERRVTSALQKLACVVNAKLADTHTANLLRNFPSPGGSTE